MRLRLYGRSSGHGFGCAHEDYILRQEEYNDKILEMQEKLDRMKLMQRKEEILDRHVYKITKCGSQWQTYVLYDGGYGGRKKLTASTKEKLEDKLVEFYSNVSLVPTVREVFTELMTERISYDELKPQSITKINSNFRRYFLENNNKLYKRKIKSVSEEDIRLFVKDTLKQYDMKQKAVSDFKTLIRQIWRFGFTKRYTTLHITKLLDDMYIPKTMIKRTERKASKQVYLQDERDKLIEYLKATDSLVDKGLLLQFQTGMRIGELSALKLEDIEENCIHIRRTEIHYRDKHNHDKNVVADTPKTEAGNRQIILTPTSRETIQMIRQLRPNSYKQGDFVFERRDGTRIRSQCFNRRLRRVCANVGIEYRSSHKIRKTYATNLINKHVDEALITEQMGHTDIETTRRYYYFLDKNDEERIRQIQQAIDY